MRHRGNDGGARRDVHVRHRDAHRAGATEARATEALRAIVRRGLLPVVPAVVYAEWWRGRTDVREEIIAMVRVEDMAPSLCRAAGEALGAVRGSSLADAVVMASAALRGGGVVYTSDADDLRHLQRHFPTVLVLSV